MPSATKAVGMVLIILFLAVAIPTMITASDDSTFEEQAEISSVGQSVEFDEALRITLDNKTTTSANLSITALQSGDTTDIQLTETETQTVQLDNSSVTVTLIEVSSASSGSVVVEATYPRELAWDEGARTISGNLPLVLASLALIIVVLMIGGVVKQ